MIKVCIQQPMLPNYRVSLFKRLYEDERFAVKLVVSKCRSDHTAPDSESLLNVETVQCLTLFGGRVFWQRGLGRVLKSSDVIVIGGNPRFISSMFLLLKAKVFKIPIIWWGHGWSATSKPWRVFIRRWLMNMGPDLILLYTEKETEWFHDRGIDHRKIAYLNNTVDTLPIEVAKKRWDKRKLNEFLLLHDLQNKICLLFCGRVTEKSELEILIQALSHLKKQLYNKVVLAVIGDGECLSGCRELACRLGVDDMIRWCGAIYSENDLAPWFMTSSIFVYPGSIGLSLNHAFAYGLPVITHKEKSKQMPEFAYLAEGVNGLTFPRSDAVALAEVIFKMTRQPKLIEKMAQGALKTIHEVCSFDSMVQRFGDAICKTTRSSNIV